MVTEKQRRGSASEFEIRITSAHSDWCETAAVGQQRRTEMDGVFTKYGYLEMFQAPAQAPERRQTMSGG
jgi:hypothetical protein